MTDKSKPEAAPSVATPPDVSPDVEAFSDWLRLMKDALSHPVQPAMIQEIASLYHEFLAYRHSPLVEAVATPPAALTADDIDQIIDGLENFCIGPGDDPEGELTAIWQPYIDKLKVLKLAVEAVATPPAPLAQYEELRAKYYELVYAVGSKFPGESRHETALRYIQRAEQPSGDAKSSELAAVPPVPPPIGQRQQCLYIKPNGERCLNYEHRPLCYLHQQP